MQREKHPTITPEQLVACMGLPAHAAEGAHVSGSQIEHFRRGWAVHIMSGGRVAHWFARDRFDATESLCGLKAPVRWMYGPGNYPRCQQCIRVMSRRIKTGREV